MKRIKNRINLLLLLMFLLSLPLVSLAQCPPPGYPDYTIDCQNGYCCSPDYPICLSDGYCGQCTPDFPIVCLTFCCPATHPICGSDGYCHQQTVTTTSTIPQNTTSTSIGGGTIGAPCTADNNCGAGGVCLTEGLPGGYCTKQCTTNTECGAGNLCVTFQLDQGPVSICLDGCTSNADCRSGYSCLNAGDGNVCFTGGSATTTTTTMVVSGNYIAAINVKGDANEATESSGTLPGTNPSKVIPLIFHKNDRPLPLILKDKFLPPLDKSLYDRTIISIKEKRLAQESKIIQYSIGDQKSFWVKDDNDGSTWRQVAAIIKKESAHGIFYVDNALNLSDSILNSYATEFEVMYNIILDNIGNFSDRDGNEKISILIYDINDNASMSGWLAGYFWMKDYLNDSETQPQGIRSNEMDIIYIRGDEPAGWDSNQFGSFAESNLSTLVHEYQHMVHFGITYWQPSLAGKTGGFDDTWINEMMSMASETMYYKKKLELNPSYTHEGMAPGGYLKDRIGYYNNDPQNSIRDGHGLAYWDSNGDVYANYSLAYIFGQYLAIHSSSGQGIFKEILNYMLQNAVFNYQAVENVAKQKIGGIASLEDLLKNWAIANLLNKPSGLYGYKNSFALTPHGPTSATVNMHNGSIVYRKIDSGCPSPVGAGPDIRYLCFNSNDTPPTTTTTISSGSTTTTTGNGTTTTTIEYNCSQELPVDCFNGFCCPANKPICGTGAKAGKCFRWKMCAASLIFGKNAYETNLLRALRDKILLQNEAGNRLSFSYYKHAAELLLIIQGNREIFNDARDVIEQLVPEMDGMLSGQQVYIDNDAWHKINILCDKIALNASPGLEADIEQLKTDFNNGKLLGDLGINQ